MDSPSPLARSPSVTFVDQSPHYGALRRFERVDPHCDLSLTDQQSVDEIRAIFKTGTPEALPVAVRSRNRIVEKLGATAAERARALVVAPDWVSEVINASFDLTRESPHSRTPVMDVVNLRGMSTPSVCRPGTPLYEKLTDKRVNPRTGVLCAQYECTKEGRGSSERGSPSDYGVVFERSPKMKTAHFFPPTWTDAEVKEAIKSGKTIAAEDESSFRAITFKGTTIHVVQHMDDRYDFPCIRSVIPVYAFFDTRTLDTDEIRVEVRGEGGKVTSISKSLEDIIDEIEQLDREERERYLKFRSRKWFIFDVNLWFDGLKVYVLIVEKK